MIKSISKKANILISLDPKHRLKDLELNHEKILLTLLFYPNNSLSDSSLSFYIDKALSNNLKLNAERKAHKATEQEINISRGEFLPNLTISGTQTSSETFNRTDSSGTSLDDTNLNTEKKSINVEQKYFKVSKDIIY